jgi:glutamate/tyrosine decarboxylase-like PLP-dependent enzyme
MQIDASCAEKKERRKANVFISFNMEYILKVLIFSIMPITAHPAFNKACSYFKIKLKRISLNPQTREVDPYKMRQAITKNTCMVNKRLNQF